MPPSMHIFSPVMNPALSEQRNTACHDCYLIFIFHCSYLKNGSIVANSSDLCTTPLVLHSTSPCLNSMSVGTDCMPYSFAVTPYLSTSTLMRRILSPNTSFTCSKMGCIILHGWHHVAKKSTKTSWSPDITSLNVSMTIFCEIMLFSFLLSYNTAKYNDNAKIKKIIGSSIDLFRI